VVFLIIILTLILSGANFTLSQGGTQETETKKEIIMLNSSQLDLEHKPVLNENRILIPLFPVFEELGAVAFYYEDTNSIICLTRDGDYIKHLVGTDLIEINGEKTNIESPSIIENKQILIPTGLISKAYPKYALHFEKDHEVNILRPVHYNEHSQIAEEILEYSIQLYFIPELYADYLDYRANNQDVSAEQAIVNVNMGLNNPFYTNIKTIDFPNDQMVLCNKYNKLPDDFVPGNLVQVPDGYYVNDGKDYRIDETVMSCFKSMADDAKDQGIGLKIISGYRSNDYQANLHKSSAARNGKEYADKYVARPGHSEHETGLAIDINSVSSHFENTESFRWLQDNAHLYGFILRYPKGKEHITGFGYEPWHYRFVGIEIASLIKEMDITFDEYCARHLRQTDYVVHTSPTSGKM